jgi:hypothetical protein
MRRFNLIFFIFFTVISLPLKGLTIEILEPEIEIQDNDIIVNTGLTDLKEIEPIINSGIEKEIVFTIELLRQWRFWPDEFVVSKKIRRTIRYDNLRGQYIASSKEDGSKIERRFKDFNNSLRNWLFRVDGLNLANIKELEPGRYYIRVLVESKSRELPKMIGLLMLFIPEVEMSLAKESKRLIDIGVTDK